MPEDRELGRIRPAWLKHRAKSFTESDAILDDRGRVIVLGIAHRPGPADSRLPGETKLVLESHVEGSFEATLALESGEALSSPALLSGASGRVWCFWETLDDDGKQVLVSQRCAESESGWHTSSPRQTLAGVSDPSNGGAQAFEEWRVDAPDYGGARPVQLRVAQSPDGSRVAATWQALVGDQYEIFYAIGTWESGMGPARQLTQSTIDEWSPSPCWRSSERLAIAFDRSAAAGAGGNDLWLAEVHPEGAEQSNSPTVRFQLLKGDESHCAEADLALDPEGHLWIAFEESDEFGELQALRKQRRIGLLRLSAQDELAEAQLAPGATPVHADFPRVMADAHGLWLSLRVRSSSLNLTTSVEDVQVDPSWRPTGQWRSFMMSFRAAGDPVWHMVQESYGTNAGNSSLQLRRGRVHLIQRAMRRPGVVVHFRQRIEWDWHVGTAELPAATGWPQLQPLEGATWSARLPETQRTPRRPDFLYGDLHRHTHLSACAHHTDGTFVDAVRYARGPGQLDFLSVTDHYQNLAPWSMLTNLRDARRWSAPGSLVVFPGVEALEPGLGHQNLVWPELAVPIGLGAIPQSERYPPGSVLAIPHMLNSVGYPLQPEVIDPERSRLIEVVQGLRGSYESPEAPHAARDARFPGGHAQDLLKSFPSNAAPPGLIGSSDHGSSSRAFVGLAHSTEGPRRVPPAAQLFADLVESANAFAVYHHPFGRMAANPGVSLSPPDTAGSSWKLKVDGPPIAHVTWVVNGTPREVQRAPDSTADEPATAGQRSRWILTIKGSTSWKRRRVELAVEGGSMLGLETDQPREPSPWAPNERIGGARGARDLHRESRNLAARFEFAPDDDNPEANLIVQVGKLVQNFNLKEIERGAHGSRGKRAQPAACLLQLERVADAVEEEQEGPASNEWLWRDTAPQPGAIYYARVVLEDGTYIWSPTRRCP